MKIQKMDWVAIDAVFIAIFYFTFLSAVISYT